MDSPAFPTRSRKPSRYFKLVVIALTIGILVVLTQTVLRRQTPRPSSVGSLLVGKPAPGFTLPTLDGKEVSLSQFRGRPILINFWASWCAPCREEMPELVRAYEEHKADGLVILGLNLTFQDSLPEVQRFANEFNITFPILLDDDEAVVERLYRIPGLPMSVFIKRNGTIERIHVGIMSGEQIEQFVGEILSQQFNAFEEMLVKVRRKNGTQHAVANSSHTGLPNLYVHYDVDDEQKYEQSSHVREP